MNHSPYDVETHNSATAKLKPGELVWAMWGSNKDRYGIFRYFLAEDANIVDGNVLLFGAADGSKGTIDFAGGAGIGTKVLGVAVGSVTDGQYGFALVYGYHDAIKTNGDDDIAAGDYLVADTAIPNDGTCDTMADGEEEQVFGYALAADVDASNTVAGHVNCL